MGESLRPTLLLAAAVCLVAIAGQARAEEFESLFNGKDFTGWVNVNCHASTWKVRDGLIECSGVPTGVLRTERQYENFILELEWKHLVAQGNAGLFVWSDDLTARGQPFTRSVELQIMDGNHGDVFSIHGATMIPDRPHPQGWMRCLPDEARARAAGQWNHYRVVCQDGRVTLAVNGKVVSGGSRCKPRRGYICLESEGSPVHFRNLRIRELPSTRPASDEIAVVDRGFRALYRGIDLASWKTEAGHEGHWVAADWKLQYDGKSAASDPNLWTHTAPADYQLIADWRWQAEPAAKGLPFLLRGARPLPAPVLQAIQQRLSGRQERGAWHRLEVTLRGSALTLVLNGERVVDAAPWPEAGPPAPLGLAHQGVPVEFANLYLRSE